MNDDDDEDDNDDDNDGNHKALFVSCEPQKCATR